jgi:hypothetical protein
MSAPTKVENPYTVILMCWRVPLASRPDAVPNLTPEPVYWHETSTN